MGLSYKKCVCLGLVVLSAAMGGCAASGSNKNVLKQTALVQGFESRAHDYCKFGQSIESEGDGLDELHLKAGKSRFNLKRRSTEPLDEKSNIEKSIDYLNVRFNWSSEIELPDMRTFNDEKLLDGNPDNDREVILESDYCVDGGELSKHLYSFGIHDLKDPRSKKRSPHVFIYVPMNLKATAPPGQANKYYLFFLSIVNDSTQCDPRAKDYPRCKALRELAIKLMDGVKGKELRDAVQARIELILPKENPYSVTSVEYHNGVIHGTF